MGPTSGSPEVPAPLRVWTIGHSSRTAPELLSLLREHGLDTLVDVRSRPWSRRHPQFGHDAMQEWVNAAGIRYRHAPGLGGMRPARVDSDQRGVEEGGFRGYADYMQTPAFAKALENLVALARGRRVAIMCAEADPDHCHRSMIADALAAHGVDVVHVVGPEVTKPHRLSAAAVVSGGRVTYPGPASLFDGLE